MGWVVCERYKAMNFPLTLLESQVVHPFVEVDSVFASDDIVQCRAGLRSL